MEDTNDKFKGSPFKTRKLFIIISCFVGIIVITGIYLLGDPTLSYFKNSLSEQEIGDMPIKEDDFDKIENGIHVSTGFIDAPGMLETVQNCTNCHSSKLVIQNRMNKERWHATIRWMQETQNLWDLGGNEKIIVDYLVENYPPEEVGRRANLTNINWYDLKEHPQTDKTAEQ